MRRVLHVQYLLCLFNLPMQDPEPLHESDRKSATAAVSFGEILLMTANDCSSP